MASRQKYFGYYHGDGFPSGAPDYFEQLAELGNSSVMLINSAHSPEKLQDMLRSADACGNKAIVSVSGCFFKGGKQGSIGSARLHEDWRERWDRFKRTISLCENVLLGFYFDEPYWNGVPEDDYRSATRAIREVFPDKKVIACLTALELYPDAFGYPIAEVSGRYYEYTTDGAYDIYRKWDPFLYGCLNEKLKRKLAPEAGIWYVVWGFTNETRDSSSSSLRENLLNFYRASLEEERCEGLLVFSYASGDAGDWGSGMDRLFDSEHRLYDPFLKNLHVNVGKAVANGKSGDLFIHSADYAAETETERLWQYEERHDVLGNHAMIFAPSRNGWVGRDAACAVYRHLSAPGTNGSQAVRIWTAPRTGEVYVTNGGDVKLAEARGSERLHIRICHNEARIWPAAEEWQAVGNGAERVEHMLKLPVQAGDTLSFIAGAAEGEYCPKLLWWDPVISYETGSDPVG